MNEVLEILKQLGPAGVIAIIAWQSFAYFLKAGERKNNVIANHISGSTKVMTELKQSIDNLSELLGSTAIQVTQFLEDEAKQRKKN